jgi:methyl-accepting chemotaxis protein
LLTFSLLAGALLTLYQKTMSDYADDQAQRRLESAERVAWDVLKRDSDQFRIVDGKLIVGQNELNGHHELVDHIKGLVGGAATIFMGDLRIATNVKKADGTRAVGAKLAAGPVYDAVLKRGEP